MAMINAYGFPHKDRGKQGVPSANDVLGDPGHTFREWGSHFEGEGPDQPKLFQGTGEQVLYAEGGQSQDEVKYGNDGTSRIWKGVPSSKAL